MTPENRPGLARIFADTSMFPEIEELRAILPIYGITTNPVIVGKEAGTAQPIDYYRRLAERFPDLPVSIQLLDDAPDELLKQAHLYAGISPNIVIKVPMFPDGRGLTVLSQLVKEGIKTNVTAMMSTEQLLLAILAGNIGAGPTYLSLFFNRIKDFGGDPEAEIARSRQLLDKFGLESQIITGSIRRGQDVVQAVMAGTHIATVQPKVIREMVSHPKSIEFIRQSQEAWQALLSQQKGDNGESRITRRRKEHHTRKPAIGR